MQIEQIEQILTPTLHSLGLELFGVENTLDNQKPVLRIYVEKPNGTINITECEKAAKVIKATMAVEAEIDLNNYNLEVSSPGLNRKLFKPEHYMTQIGKQVKVQLHEAIACQKNFKGVLQHADLERIILAVDNIEHEFLIQNIAHANVIFSINGDT